jgi:Sporulation and spore germination/WD40-like Beta Propeller Repeat
VDSRPLRLRLLRPIAALVALGGLAACTAGVPQTGDVVTVGPVTTSLPQEDADAIQELGDPSSGQNEVEVATGYMRAMNTGDVTKIQRWVVSKDHDKVRHWSNEATTVRVYSVFEPDQPQVREDGRRVVPVKVKLVGQLQNGRDWYPATGDDVLNLELGNDGAETRVANPSGIWMRDVNFARLYASTEVYLVADKTRPAPRLAAAPVFVRRGDGDGDAEVPKLALRHALELLLAGPRGRYRNLDTAIPEGTVLRSFRYADNLATVDLSRRFAEAGGSGQLRVGQVVWTVNRLLPTASVRILVEDRPVRTVGDEQFRTGRTWRRRDMPLAAMLPQRSPERQDDAVLFVRRGEIFTVTPEAGQPPQLKPLNARGTKSAPTWSPDRRSMAFLAGTGNKRVLWVTQPDRDRAFLADELSGRLSPPSWSPDSKRVYVVSRDETGARLLEVSRRTLGVRQLSLPALPGGLRPSSVTVSPDGAFVLAVADRPDRKVLEAEPVPGGQLFLGQFGPDGVIRWSPRQLAPGLGRVFSPVWVDPVTVAFIAETGNKDDLGKLWTVRSDGWDPTAVLNDTGTPIGDIGNQLTVDPSGSSFIVPARSSNGISLWMVNRQQKSVSYLTTPAPTAFDVDPSFASR